MSSVIFLVVLFILMILKNKNCLLMCLLSLEGLVLMILYLMMFKFSEELINYNSIISFMYVIVAESSMGLGLMVLMIRGVGNDMFLYHNIM